MRHAILAAALSCVSFGFVFAADDNTAKQGLPAGVTAKELNDQEDVRSVLAAATNAAATKGGFDDLVERLSSADRKRLDEFANDREFSQLDGRIEQIRKNWEQKYGESFDLNDANLLQGMITVQEGEITDATAARSAWPVPARATMDKATNTPATVDYLENGRNVAVVRVAASHNLPAVNVSMLHEPVDDWRIDVPDTVTGQQLHDNVLTALTQLGDNVAAWPADKSEAYRKFAHRLLLAIHNVPAEGVKGAAADTR